MMWLYKNRIPTVALDLERTKQIKGADMRLERGSIISGSTGMGKSTLRFHLIYYFQRKGYSIIDIDLKGENSRYIKKRIYIPGVNFGCNLFDLIDSPSSLYTLLSGILSDLTPPQNALLEQSVTRTMQYSGTLQDLFYNILIVGHQNAVRGTGSPQTPLALLHRLIFLQNELGTVFNVEKTSTFDRFSDLFFNLRYLITQTSLEYISIFIDIILFSQVLHQPRRTKTAIFIDESQILLSDRTSSSLPQIVTTLRARHIPVFLFATRTDFFSPFLLDSSNFCLFRSNSVRSRFMRDYNVTELNPYEFLLSSPERKSVSKCKIVPFEGVLRTASIPSAEAIQGKLRKFRFDADSILIGIIITLCRQVFGQCTLKFKQSNWKMPLLEELLKLTRKISFARNIDPISVISGLIEHNTTSILSAFQSGDIANCIRMIVEFFRKLKKSIDEMQEEFIVMKYH